MASALSRFAGFCLAVLAVVSCSAQEDEEAPIVFRTPAQMPKVATSAGGFVKVVAADIPGDAVGFRLPILQFTTRLYRELERAYRLEMPRGGTGLVIHALDGMSNDTRVVSRTFRRRGELLTRVWLPSPGFSDLEELKLTVAKAYFQSWIDRHAAESRTAYRELPDWFVQGALRAGDIRMAHDDIRYMLELWSDARLPFFPVICTDMHVARGRGVALPGYLVAWIREKHLVKKILLRLAAGEIWDGRRLAEELTGEKDPVEQDRASDERLARLTRAVLSPGAASMWDLKVFTSRLLLYPPVFDKNTGAGRTSYTFEEAVGLAETSESIRLAALRKAREMPLCVLGRGDALAAVGESYRQFLLGVVRGEKPDALRPLLQTAEAKMETVLNENREDDNR